MNKYLLYLIVLPLTFAVWAFSGSPANENPGPVAPPAGIQFLENSWAKALERAKKENKPIFLDAYASWCGPCKLLKKNTFTKKEAGDFFNAHFVNVDIDMEKGDGPSLSENFDVDANPPLIIAAKNGNIVQSHKG